MTKQQQQHIWGESAVSQAPSRLWPQSESVRACRWHAQIRNFGESLLERPFPKMWARYRETTGRVQHQGGKGWAVTPSPSPPGLQPWAHRAVTRSCRQDCPAGVTARSRRPPRSEHEPHSPPTPTSWFPWGGPSRNQRVVEPVPTAHSGQSSRHRGGWRVNLEGPRALFF